MLEVSIFHTLEAVAAYRAQLAELNRASRQKSPFTTLEFFENYLQHDEFYVVGKDLEVWFLIAFEAGAPVGYLALRRVRERAFGLSAAKLEFLATHDVERPHAVCKPEDEARCIEAFYRALLERKADWSMLELKQQAPDAQLLFMPASLPLSAHYVRPFESMTVSVIHNRFTDVLGYLNAMEKKARSNVKRQLRNLLAAGEVRYLYSEDPEATPLLLDLYLDVERHSWKARVGGTIHRDERRIAFFRGMLAATMPFRIGIGLLLLDGVPIAGSIVNAYERRLHATQVVFDDRFSRLTPGTLLFAMLMKETIDTKAEHLDLMSGFSYYKSRWLAETTDCQSLQIFRVGSALFYKAIAGDLRRKLEERLRGPIDLEAENVAKHESAVEAAGIAGEGAPADRRIVETRLATLATKAVRAVTAAELDAFFDVGLAKHRPDARRLAS
ncbi:MAG: GNAT family N-acetyltransferase [Deltaproteobacteria bacterium]|nr:GNAT family N-acetyltransferase [Deltaproteobacteria bacterium]